MNSLRTTLLIARRDFKERVTSRAFQVSTGITVLLVVGLLVAPTFFDDVNVPKWTIGTIGEVPEGIATQIEATAPIEGTTATLEPLADEAAAEQALREGEVDIVISGDRIIITDEDTDPQLTTLLTTTAASVAVLERAQELGIADQLGDLLGAGAFEVRTLEPENPEEETSRNIALIGTILLFISIVTYGQWILIGVIEEKSNRVVEVVLGAVRPHQLLAGKVLGIGVLGLIQLVLIAAIGGFVATRTDVFDIPATTIGIAIWIIVWFILGFAFYATGYAATGSLVSRQEEAQNAAFPLTILLMAAYFVATFSFTGDNPVLRIFSLLPPFAPMTMPIRMAGGDALVWEVALSLTLMVVAIYLLIRLAGRVYSGGLLRSGKRVKLLDAWRSAEA